jgi:hypothetical protein
MRPSSVLLRACGRGKQSACNIARRLKTLDVLYAGSVLTFADVKEKSDNPNHLPFTGTLLLTDVASDKPPHGSEGHRIYVSTEAAKKAIIDLPGQAVNYQPENLSAHASRHKVGVITKAWMAGNKVKVSGFIWVHDFPEARVLRNRSDLGMSMELANVLVQDEDADVWNLEKFSFTGGTILKKSAAAYTKTDLAAVAAAAEEQRGATMKHSKEKDKRKVAAAHRDTGQDNNVALMTQAISSSLGEAVRNAMTPLLTQIKASHEDFIEGLEEIKGLHLINAAASGNSHDEDEEEDDQIVVHAQGDASASASAAEEEEEEEEMAAAHDASASMNARGKGNPNFGGNGGGDGSQDDAEEDDSSSSASAEEMEAMEDMGLEDPSEEPGELNKHAASRGSKTTVTKPPTQGEHFKGNVAKGRLHAKGGDKVKKPFPKLHSRADVGHGTSIQAAAVMIGDLQASVRQMRRQMKAQAEEHGLQVRKLNKRLQRVTAQAARFAELEGRHSQMSAELVNLGEKVGVDFNEARIGGQKFSVRAFDTILAAAEQSGIVLNPQQRIAMKMMAEEHGLLDEGVVNRMGRA